MSGGLAAGCEGAAQSVDTTNMSTYVIFISGIVKAKQTGERKYSVQRRKE